jgi:hypothetical protein
MQEENVGSSQERTTAVTTRHPESSEGVTTRQLRAVNTAGLLFVFFGLVILLVAVVISSWLVVRTTDPPSGAVEFFSFYGIPFLLIVTAAAVSMFGYLLLRSAGAANRQVIPPEDRELLSTLILEENTTEGFQKYVTLAGFSGVTGFFHKIGVSGLPLATIFLTLAFALLAITNLGGQAAAFADLANLGLGAFLGSFVQRQALPGQPPTVPVQPPPPATPPAGGSPAATNSGSIAS